MWLGPNTVNANDAAATSPTQIHGADSNAERTKPALGEAVPRGRPTTRSFRSDFPKVCPWPISLPRTPKYGTLLGDGLCV